METSTNNTAVRRYIASSSLRTHFLYYFIKADTEEQNSLLTDAFSEILTKAHNGAQYYVVHTLDKEVVDKPLELNHSLFHSSLRYVKYLRVPVRLFRD